MLAEIKLIRFRCFDPKIERLRTNTSNDGLTDDSRFAPPK